MTSPEILSALNAIEDKLTRTPTAFNWTPAMSAVFPVRLTMSQLSAMWEALHGAAEYTSPKSLSKDDASAKDVANYNLALETAHSKVDNEWIVWFGGNCPVDGLTQVECQLRYGMFEGLAKNINWSRQGSDWASDIIAYKLSK